MSDDVLSQGKLLTVIAHLLIPGKRDWAIKKLSELDLLDQRSQDALSRALAETKYNYRNTGVRLSNVKAFIDGYVESHEYCFLNPRRTMIHIRRRVAASPLHFSREVFANSTVLDYGCGTLNALSQSIIFVANGAKMVFAVEPASTKWDMTRRSALELIKAIFDSPEDFNFTGSSPDEIRSRVASIDFTAIKAAAEGNKSGHVDLGAIQMYDWLKDIPSESKLDLIVSTSVLEHVNDLAAEIELQRSFLKKGGAAIHAVDFTDHRHDDPEYHPFKFYFDGRMKDCNGLRVGQMADMFRSLGLNVSTKDVKKDSNPIDRSVLIERFLGFSLDDLATRSATFVLTHQ